MPPAHPERVPLLGLELEDGAAAEAIRGPEEHAAARARGASLSLDDALELALGVEAPSSLG
jgi:hypothetical protein